MQCRGVWSRYVVGVDVGGTFTDGVVLDVESGRFWRIKVLTTVEDPSVGVVECVKALLNASCVGLEDVLYISHASTIGSNLLLGQEKLELPKVMMIVTKGFRDVIFIGRQCRPEVYSLCFRKPKPPVNYEDIVEVDERVNAKGEVVQEVSDKELEDIVNKVRQANPDVICVCFLNSYINPHNEVKVKKFIEERLGTPVVASSEVVKICKEYERFSTALVNAVLIPVVAKYIHKLCRAFEKTRLFIVASYGGLIDVEHAVKLPVLLIESGPAAGAVACSEVAKLAGLAKAVGFDMGGTTAKFSTIVDGKPFLTDEYEVGGRVHMGRRVRGTGLPVAISMIDLVEVSAGGGTIVWVDEYGALRVGPQSAGADPGPACYGKGGTRPTITDAHVVIGRIGRALLKGEFPLRKDLAVEAFRKHVLEHANLTLEEAAYGAVKLINTHMARGMKIAILERGLDPREFTIVAYGGAGPLHACELAQELNIRRVLIPPAAGVFTALGMTLAPFTLRDEVSIYKTVDEVDIELVKTTAQIVKDKLLKYVRENIGKVDNIIYEFTLGMRYINQDQELHIDFKVEDNKMNIVRKFEERYRLMYGHVLTKVPIEVTRLTVTVRVKLADINLRVEVPREVKKPHENSIIEEREVYTGTTWVKVKVFDRDKLSPGDFVEGPAIVEDYDTTVYIPEGWSCRCAYGNFLLIEKC